MWHNYRALSSALTGPALYFKHLFNLRGMDNPRISSNNYLAWPTTGPNASACCLKPSANARGCRNPKRSLTVTMGPCTHHTHNRCHDVELWILVLQTLTSSMFLSIAWIIPNLLIATLMSYKLSRIPFDITLVYNTRFRAMRT